MHPGSARRAGPVLPVPLDDGQPSAGPLTSPALLERYLTALRSLG